MHDDDLVPLVTVAAELGVDVNNLASRFGDAVVCDTAGVRCIPVERSRVYIAAVHAAAQAEHERCRARQAELAANDPIKQFRQRLRARHQAQAPIGAPGEPLAPGQALAAMKEADGSRERQLARAAAKFDELTRGTLKYHPINENQE